MAEFQFRLHVEPLLKWDGLTAEVRKYLEEHGDSIDLLPIIGRYTASVREFYKWFWLKVDEKMKPQRVEYDAHVAELIAYGEEVFLAPDWIRKAGGEPPPGWNGARWRRRSLAELRRETMGARAQIISRHHRRRPRYCRSRRPSMDADIVAGPLARGFNPTALLHQPAGCLPITRRFGDVRIQRSVR